jgi:cyclohexadieny/prephenate dehydrogenase
MLYDRMTIIGMGLIGASIARAARQYGLAKTIIGGDISQDVCDRAAGLGLADQMTTDLCAAVKQADLVILCVPVGAMAAVGEAIAPCLKPGATLSDVGSVKGAIVRDLGPIIPNGVHFIPGHPIAGTEFSGPEAGFAELFKGRYCVLCPVPGTNENAISRLNDLWQQMGSKVEIMEAAHHDRVLAITSHLPHLIAYTIVGTATDLAEETREEVIKFSASGFRDFTRIAASDPVMWRDIFLNNREGVLEMLQRFSEDLTALQRAIRWGDGDSLHQLFSRTRAIRRSIIDANQA